MATKKKPTKATPKQADELPKDWDLTYPYDRKGNRIDQPTQKASTSEKDTQKVSITQLDRIEALLLELVETNRKLHPDIGSLLNSGFKR